MDQGVRDGSRINRGAMDQGIMIGAMDGHAMDQDGSRINRISD